MDDEEINSHLKYYADRYPSLISVEQAMEIAAVSRKSIYHWSSTGKLDRFKSKRGRHIRFGRNGFVRFLVEDDAAPQ